MLAQKTGDMKDLDGKAIVSNLEAQIQILISAMNQYLDENTLLATSAQSEALEQSLQSQARQLADLMMALQLQKTMVSLELQSDIKAFLKHCPRKYRHCGWRTINIRFSGGSIVPLSIAYYARNCDQKKKGKGIYPALVLMGIHDRCTSGLVSEVSMTSAALCSLDEAREVLKGRGIKLNIKTIRNIVKRFSSRARLLQKHDDTVFKVDTETIKNRRVVVSVDGGRIRIRETKRGPKTKKGRSRFKTDWREPKLFIIYIVNDKGRQDKIFAPYIDGTMDGPDALFSMLAYYLKKINVSAADKLLFIADGALWIWDRIKALFSALRLDPSKCYELLDFYHAVEHLSSIANMKRQWTEKQRRAWVKKNRKRLKQGQSELVINVIKDICKGTQNKLLKRERAYFIKNRLRLSYLTAGELMMPIGSGAIESSIRRVVNLRLKGPCIFWNEDSANEMLMLRCYYKAGRWGMLNTWATLPVVL